MRGALKRLGQVAVTAWGGSLLVFGSLYLAPGSPLATLSGGRSLTPEAIEALTARYHLDEPFAVRYWTWLTGVWHGDLGDSILYKTSVASLVGTGVSTSWPIVALAFVMVVLVGVPLGLWAGLASRRVDGALSTVMSVGLALTSFVVAPLLAYVFAVRLGWFPVVRQPGATSLRDMVLPATALAISLVAYVGRVTRATVRENRRSDHAEFARLRGMSRSSVIRDHVVRNSLIGVVTVAGLTVAALVGGLAVVEVAFNINGLGYYLVAAVNARDYALVQGITLVLFVFFVTLTVLLDMLYPLLDPRLRRSGGER